MRQPLLPFVPRPKVAVTQLLLLTTLLSIAGHPQLPSSLPLLCSPIVPLDLPFAHHALSAARLGPGPQAVGPAGLRAAPAGTRAVERQRRKAVRIAAHQGSPAATAEAPGAAPARKGL